MARSAAQPCRNGCGVMIYFDYTLPQGKSSTGKFIPLVYIEADDDYTGAGHNCPRSQYNLNKAAGGSSQPQQQQQTQQVATKPETQQGLSSVRSDVWLIPKDDWDKVQSNISAIRMQQDRLSEYYGDIVDHLRTLSSVIKKEEGMAASEARYDQDKEDGDTLPSGGMI